MPVENVCLFFLNSNYTETIILYTSNTLISVWCGGVLTFFNVKVNPKKKKLNTVNNIIFQLKNPMEEYDIRIPPPL